MSSARATAGGPTLAFDIRVTRSAGFALNVSAELPLFGITVITGASGSGKTTLLRALAGLEPGAAGKVTFAGRDWSRRPAEQRGIGYVFQDARLFPHLNVRRNLEYGAKRRRGSPDMMEAVIDALELRPLLDRSPATLSGGEAHRVALGRALASGPRLLLLDEPFTGLDSARKAALMPYVARAVAEFQVPALYVTHSEDEMRYLADRSLTLQNGQIIHQAGPQPGLVGTVVNVAPQMVQLAVGDVRVWAPGQGRLGETWTLPVGPKPLLSTQDPGNINAGLVMEAVIVRTEPAQQRLQVKLAGQMLMLWWGGSFDHLMAERRMWLVLPEVVARPVQLAT